MSFLDFFRVVYRLLADIASWRRLLQRKLEGRGCPILRLPVDLIFRISNQLDPASLHTFSQTCCSLRVILGTHSRAENFSLEDRWEYLAAIARDIPDHWVCEACCTLHPVCELDTPHEPSLKSCPLSWRRWRHAGYGQQQRLDNRLFRVDHRHIQLALKYTRLQIDEFQDYLRSLLAPHINDKFETFTFPHKRPNVLAVHYSVIPKIVRDHVGNYRYLMLSTWRYHPDLEPVTIMAMGELRICPHLILHPGRNGPSNMQSGSLREIIGTTMAKRQDGVQMTFGYCRYCPTDFCVVAYPDHVVLGAWQDMGTEGSPMDVSWRVHVFNPGKLARSRKQLIHEPGSVRQLYHKKG
ncbi:hypothetical protein F4804DRAFT_300194 [Jackrogersella minutella]|nr:hypothetical protein F4804DRAFT_300194 [Jackrogersella minutella]